MTLDKANGGESLTVLEVPANDLHASLLRLGIEKGARITCILKMPSGPVVVRHGNTDVALGRHIAAQIEVQKADDGPTRKAWRWRHRQGRD
jgi:Fe2+ transport system protein FeoA